MTTPTITQAYPPLSWEKINFIKNNAWENFDSVKELLNELIFVHPFVKHLHESKHVYWRARPVTNKLPFTNVKDLLWPPAEYLKIGRANLDSEALLYLADRRDTAITEVCEGKEELEAHFIGVNILPGKQIMLAIIGEIFNIYRTGKGILSLPEQAKIINSMINACDSDEAIRLIVSDALIYDLFCKNDDYKITSYISKKIREKSKDIDGFIYISSKQQGALNVAVLPEAYQNNWGIISSFYSGKCKHIYKGLWEISDRVDVMGIQDNGDFVMNNHIKQNNAYLMLDSAFTGGGNDVIK